MAEMIRWEPVGEASCPCCSARYQVAAATTEKRAFAYVRCEECGIVIDEWISNVVRAYTPVENRAA